MGNAPRGSQSNEVISIRASQFSKIHTTSISLVPDVDLLVHIHKNSFKFVETGNGVFLTFRFDSKKVCLITIYYFGVEVFNKSEDHTLYFAVNTNRYPSPNCFKFPKGMNCDFPAEVSKILLKKYSEELNLTESHNQYHVIVTIKPEGKNQFPYESSFLKIEKERETWKLVLMKQKLHFEDSSYYLQEIYGLSGEGNANSCVVCLTGKCIVTLMPCKHLCLCDECAQILAEAAVKKCPMCRTCNLHLAVNELIFIQQ